LGHPEGDRRRWVVYLFGLGKRQEVDEIRLAAMEVEEHGEHRWIVGKPDRKAEQAYRAHHDSLARRRFPGRDDVPVEYRGFPLAADRFELTTQGATIRATHPASGAAWQVTVPRE